MTKTAYHVEIKEDGIVVIEKDFKKFLAKRE